MSISLRHIDKAFNQMVIYRDFSMNIPDKRISCILGPSGCGKTSLLNMIGGILPQDHGSIEGAKEKQFSFIFHEPRLLPWKSIRKNLELVLDNQPIANKNQLIDRYLRVVGLEHFADYYPGQLSGGMKQRVAIARAFSYPSDTILMDEPLQTLDPRLKWNLMKTFLKIWNKDKRTVVFVTHDVDEALVLGEEIFVFSQPPVQIKHQFTNTLSEQDKNNENQKFFDLKNSIINILD